MLIIQGFTVNPYQENTWVIADQHGSCAIIDPGCHTHSEQKMLKDYLDAQGWKPVVLLNTHGHVDHMLGNAWIQDQYGIPFYTHRLVVQELDLAVSWGHMMGIQVAESPAPDRFLEAGEFVQVGEEQLEVIFTPGHSPGHISFYHQKGGHLFSGDVLFQGSIGRTDLPGGDQATLMKSIDESLLPLDDQVIVYPGHGASTTIGVERATNPFILAYLNS